MSIPKKLLGKVVRTPQEGLIFLARQGTEKLYGEILSEKTSYTCKSAFKILPMTTWKIFTEMALSFAGTEQKSHFERLGFKVSGKRMFATYLPENNTANIFLTSAEQAVFCKMDAANIYPVPNKWGEKGATTFVLDKVPPAIIMEALLSAYTDIVKKK